MTIPALVELDSVTSIDTHIETLPNGAPLPLPRPISWVILNLEKMLPIVGTNTRCTPLATVNAGDSMTNMPPHLPMVGPFVKPPECSGQIMEGTQNNLGDDEVLAVAGAIAIVCADIGAKGPSWPKAKKPVMGLISPTGVAIPSQATVLSAPPTTISMSALATDLAVGALAGPLMKGLGKALKKGKDAAKDLAQIAVKKGPKSLNKTAADVLHKANNKLRDKGKISKSAHAKNKKSICEWTGHPVDVATGRLMTDEVDFELNGPIPFAFERTWYSCSGHKGPLGNGWHHSYDMSLMLNQGVLIIHLPDGRYTGFESLAIGEGSYNAKEQLGLVRISEGVWELSDLEGMTYVFAREEGKSPRLDPNFEEVIHLTSIKDAFNHEINFFYDLEGRLIRILDSVNRKIWMAYNEQGYIAKISMNILDEEGTPIPKVLASYEYDFQGNLVKHSDPRTKTATLEYRYHHGLLIEEKTKDGTKFYFEWDDFNKGLDARCTKTWGDNNLFYRELNYDRIEDLVTVVTDGKGGKTTYYSNFDGLVIKEIDPLGRVRRTQWSDSGLKLEEELFTGEKITNLYDSQDNLLATTSNFSGTETYQYDESGNIIQVIDPDGLVWKSTFNDKNQIISSIDPSGVETQFSYDETGYLREEIHPLGTRTLNWNSRGQVEKIEDRLGRISTFQYDHMGNVIRQVDPNENVHTYDWDFSGNLLSKTDPEGNTENFEYDESGQLTKYIDPLDRKTRISYGPMGVIKIITQANGKQIKRFYDAELELEEVRNHAGKTWKFERDIVGRVISETSFDKRYYQFELNNADQLTKVTNQLNEQTQYQRNELGQLTEIHYADGKKETFVFDDKHRLIEVNNSDEFLPTTFEYDKLGLIKSETQHQRKTEFHRDELNRISGYSTDGLGSTQFNLDAEDQLLELRHEEKTIGQFSYDQNGFEVARILGSNALNTQKSYTRSGLLKEQINQTKNNVHSFIQQYVWNEASELKEKLENKRKSTKYVHDQVGKLTEVIYPDGKVQKFLEQFNGETPGSFLFKDDEPNVAKVTIKDGFELFWDHLGRLTGKRGNRKLQTFEYDCANRLVKAYTTDEYKKLPYTQIPEPNQMAAESTLAHYTYDPFGRRLRKKVWNQSATGLQQQGKSYVETEFLWSGDNIIGEKSSNSAQENHFIYRPGTFELISKRVGEHYFYIESDLIGTPQRAIDEDGQVAWDVDFEAFGAQVFDNVRREAFEGFISHRFQGQWYDEETGLAYNRFRYYDASLRCYTQPDPIGLVGGMEPYGYVDDPCGWVDVFGLAPAWQPHSAAHNDIISKGPHFNAGDSKKTELKLGVDSKGKLTFDPVFSKDSAEQVSNAQKLAKEKFETDPQFRKKLLDNAGQVKQSLYDNHNRLDRAREVKRIEKAIRKEDRRLACDKK